jgi:hypothetical protein
LSLSPILAAMGLSGSGNGIAGDSLQGKVDRLAVGMGC